MEGGGRSQGHLILTLTPATICVCVCVCERDSVCDSWANATGRHPRLPLQPTVASAVRLQAHVWLAVYRARGQSLSEASASRGRLRSCLLHPQGYMAQSMSEQATESKSDARTRDGEGGAQGPPVSPARSPRARARAGGGSRAAVPSGERQYLEHTPVSRPSSLTLAYSAVRVLVAVCGLFVAGSLVAESELLVAACGI